MARLVRAQVESALTELEKDYQRRAAGRKDKELLTSDDQYHMLITLKLMPAHSTTSKPHRIPIPHSFYSNAELCIFTPDDQKHYRELLIDALEIPNLKKVVSFTKLRKNYARHEAKRKLCNSYDMFLVDKSVVPLVAPLLGREFYRGKKQPVPVELASKDIPREIARAVSSTYLIPPRGVNFTVKVGNTGQTPEQVTDNVMAAMDGVVRRIPQRWESIQAVNLKTSCSVALPVYNSLPRMAMNIEESSLVVSKKRKRLENESEKKEKAGDEKEVDEEEEEEEKAKPQTPKKAKKPAKQAKAAKAPATKKPRIAASEPTSPATPKPKAKSAASAPTSPATPTPKAKAKAAAKATPSPQPKKKAATPTNNKKSPKPKRTN